MKITRRQLRKIVTESIVTRLRGETDYEELEKRAEPITDDLYKTIDAALPKLNYRKGSPPSNKHLGGRGLVVLTFLKQGALDSRVRDRSGGISGLNAIFRQVARRHGLKDDDIDFLIHPRRLDNRDMVKVIIKKSALIGA